MRVFCGLKVVAEFAELDGKTVKARHSVAAEMDELDPAKWAKVLESLVEYRDAAPADTNPQG